MTDRVLVTGVTGFIAAHITHRLLDKGYQVRGTVRNTEKAQKVVKALAAKGANTDNLELVEANLTSDAGWADAVKDCRFIQHTASPFPAQAPKDREALVPAAKAGALRVLEHGLTAGAERIVLTSSIVAMLGQAGKGRHMTLTEADWSDPEWKHMRAYPVSKTRAEQAAWDYVRGENIQDRLVTVNPGFVLGPDTYGNAGTSLKTVKAMMVGKIAKTSKVAYPVVDVRDCADIHVAAMTAAQAGGRRLLATADTLWLKDYADIIRQDYPSLTQLPTDELPNWLMRATSLFNEGAKGLAGSLGVFHDANSGYVTELTGITCRPAREAVLASAKSLIESGQVKT